jgi:hypothetical protein
MYKQRAYAKLFLGSCEQKFKVSSQLLHGIDSTLVQRMTDTLEKLKMGQPICFKQHK